MSLNYERIGKHMQFFRKKKGLSQAELAEKTDLSLSYISHVENAVKKASLDSYIRIANALDVTVDQLLSGNQNCNHNEYQIELFNLLADCSNYERGVIYDVVSAVKLTLREHADLYTCSDKTAV